MAEGRMNSNVSPVAHLDAVRIRGELRKLWDGFKETPPGSRERKSHVERIDGLLDERLEQKGTHPADCSCWECSAHVADVMARRLGECVDPQDVATEGRW